MLRLVLVLLSLVLIPAASGGSATYQRGAGATDDGTQVYAFHQLEPVVAAWIGKESVLIDCLSMSAYGMASPDTMELWINRRFCKPLSALLGGLEILPKRTADGLLTVAHEATHLTGVFNEAQTECIAMQKVDDLALHMGASSLYAARLGDLGFKLSMEFQAAAPPYRNWRKCRQDGKWDLTPGDGIWP